jgi:D-glycero-D-manno-heptose 1,7-bisphosphate phosphatase
MRVSVGARGAVFLDRDGTLNVKLEDDYVTTPDQLILLPGAAEAVAEINRYGRKAVVITNQRGIALGRMTEADLAAVHEHLAQLISQTSGGTLTGIVHCPHGQDECECRKPLPGMFLEAVRRWPDLNLSESVMIGDAPSDVEAAQAAGVQAFRIGVDVPDLLTAVHEAIVFAGETRE